MKYIDPNAHCCACGKMGVALHHVRTRKSGGSDSAHNLMPLCMTHHTEVHTTGLIKFADKYEKVKSWLYRNKWEQGAMRWRHTGESA